MKRFASVFSAKALLTAASVVALLAGAAPGRAADDIVIGASVPMSGVLGGFGAYLKWGYERAVRDANAAGGVTTNGKKTKVRLVVRDDASNPNTTVDNLQTLVSREGAVALLGSAGPALVHPGALAAERLHVPFVTGADPTDVFASVRPWKYSWDLFFSGAGLAEAPFKAFAELSLGTNKKIAIMHDNSPDATAVGGELWPMFAKKYGYEIVSNATFPVESTEFTSMISQAKAKVPDIVLVDTVTPDAIALRKQFQSSAFAPKILIIEKAAEPQQFAQALGPLADGVMLGGFWDPSFPYPGAANLRKQFEADTGLTWSQHIANSYAAAQIILDAMTKANSADPAKINAAIAETDKTYVVGPIKFDVKHISALPVVVEQWQKGATAIIAPKSFATGAPLFPMQASN